MAVSTSNLKTLSNADVLNRIRKRASPDYRNRIPEATQANIQDTMRKLMEYRPARNEFIDALVNRIGLVIARNNSWSNPLSEFKRGMMPFGDTIEEYHMGLIKAKTYDTDRDSGEKELFGTHRAEVQSSFHTVNRQDKYVITIDNPMLNRAFLEKDGLTNFIDQTMQAVSTSDEWDEFLTTCQLFSEYEFNNGFFKVQIPDNTAIASTEADAKQALRIMRAMADNLTFLSTKYNPAGMPMFAKRSDLLLFVTPEFNAALDVEALAGAFNISSAQIHGRIIPIPADQFGIDGVQAIMTTSDFFVIADTLFETAQLYNPDQLQNNQWLHHHQIVSASRFVPAIMFTSKAVDVIEIVPNEVTSIGAITLTDREGDVVTDVTRGELYQLFADVVTTLEDGTLEAVRWNLEGAHDLFTYIEPTGVLHVSGTEAAASLTVRGTTVWIDPTGVETAGETTTAALTVSGDKQIIWPVPAPVVSAPVITSIVGSPNPAGAGEVVEISGTGFIGATAVTFGGVAATDYTVINGGRIDAVLPAGAAGAVAVIVTNSAGASAPVNYTRDA